MFAIASNGDKLIPYVITISKLPIKAPNNGIIVHRNQRGWLYEQELIHWIKNVLLEYKKKLSKKTELVLLLDNCTVHKLQSVKTYLTSLGIRFIYIPPWMTFMLLPLDTHIHRSVKAKISQYFDNWMVNDALKPENMYILLIIYFILLFYFIVIYI